MCDLDPRRSAFRPELADAALKGRVAAQRFVAGEVLAVSAARAPLRRQPADAAALDTEALCGERVRCFETTPDGWAWVQLSDDRYVGWMPRKALSPPEAEPTHRVQALSTLLFAAPDIKSPLLANLPLGAKVAVIGEAQDHNARYALIAPRGAIVTQHLAPLGDDEADWTAVAERFIGTPYLWGGKTSHGIDCSGLVQIALQSCGFAAPRDSDMQEAELGTTVPLTSGLPRLRRGDLVFWAGHLGLMRDAETLLHANAYHMAVAVEPLRAAIARLSAKGSEITAIRRLSRQ